MGRATTHIERRLWKNPLTARYAIRQQEQDKRDYVFTVCALDQVIIPIKFVHTYE